MWTEVQTDRTNLIVAFPNFSKASEYPKADYLNPGITESCKYGADILPATPQRYGKRITGYPNCFISYALHSLMGIFGDVSKSGLYFPDTLCGGS
jgi:hypothetical protein